MIEIVDTYITGKQQEEILITTVAKVKKSTQKRGGINDTTFVYNIYPSF